MADDRLRNLPLREYRPRSSLRLPEHQVPRARFPVVDAHNHLGRWLTEEWSAPDVGELLDVMDACGIQAIVNLDGMWGDELAANLDRYDRAHPGRFLTFCHVDLRSLGRPGFDAGALVASLQRSSDAGARGLKIWKDLGLGIRDPRGEYVLPDDARLSPLFAAAGDLHLPVLIHTADPVAFWDPVDGSNERLEELQAKPEWSYFGSDFPSFDRLMESLEARIAANPGTTFIVAHVGCYPENLAWVDRMLSSYPNMVIDVSQRMAELGRQPRAAARLITNHREQVLFGTDCFPPPADLYRRWYRFLESDDECFPYFPFEGAPPQGRWAISALNLPADVLVPVYRTNALRILGIT
jgi:predicted TIM-barrel fold metal-dependent hydrolase